MTIFEELESEVRSYCRSWPAVFDKAEGSRLYDRDGRSFVDFFSGAGALNYGHNHPVLQEALIAYLRDNRVVHSLDMHTTAKAAFLEKFRDTILRPRQLDYVVQFPGPTGTNAVEAALKLARKVTGREQIVSFTNAFHGMTLGSLSVTGNSMKRSGAGVPLTNATTLPYCRFLEDDVDSIDILGALLEGAGSGLDQPAAVIVETLQGEGGVNPASVRWLRRLAETCAQHDILMIVDDVQMGCGRTGPFFSFEMAGITPDIVTMSKSLSGSGLPFALTLFKREHDVWQPGEHNGTFRGANPAFVTATAALEAFWGDETLSTETVAKGRIVQTFLEQVAVQHKEHGTSIRGRGLIWGLAFDTPGLAEAVCLEAFTRGLLLETSGPSSEVVKLMPPLTSSIDDDLELGFDILEEATDAATERLEATVQGKVASR